MRTLYVRVIAVHNATWSERDVGRSGHEHSRWPRSDPPAGADHADGCGVGGTDLPACGYSGADDEPRGHTHSKFNSADFNADAGAHAFANAGTDAAADELGVTDCHIAGIAQCERDRQCSDGRGLELHDRSDVQQRRQLRARPRTKDGQRGRSGLVDLANRRADCVRYLPG